MTTQVMEARPPAHIPTDRETEVMKGKRAHGSQSEGDRGTRTWGSGHQLGHLPVIPPLQAGGGTQAVFQADLAAECKGGQRFESRKL